MKFVARVVATLLFGALILKPAFADDTATASANTPNSEAGATNATNTPTGDLPPVIPMEPMQTPSTRTSSGDSYPAVDLFVGYSYVRFNTNTTVNEHFNWHGVTGSLAGNVNRWFSLVADLSTYRMKKLTPGITGSSYLFLFGPQFSRRGEKFTPFAHALFGAGRLADINVSVVPSPSQFFNRSFNENAFATALGGGLDWNFNKHVSWRTIQADYLITKFTDGFHNRQNNIRLATGLVLHFGGNPPPPPPNHPPTVTVTATPTKVNAGSGDSIVLTATANDPDNDTLNYKWSATGGGIEGTGSEVRWNSNGVKEGTYTATV